jgi:hypothetical protein
LDRIEYVECSNPLQLNIETSNRQYLNSLRNRRSWFTKIRPGYQWDGKHGVFIRGPWRCTPRQAVTHMENLRKEKEAAEVLRDKVDMLEEECDKWKHEAEEAMRKWKMAEKKIGGKIQKRKYNLRSQKNK